MKLSRLLIGLITLLWVVVFFATLYVVVHSTRDYLRRAMESHAQDTATSLGLSITQSKSFNDPVTIELMTSAIFDRGYYSEIEVKKITGEPIFKKRVDQTVQGVPAWFVKWFPLPAPRMNALVMDGWRKAAVVEVESHPGFAYSELWQIACKSFWVLLAVAVLSLLTVMIVLRLALKPLEDMERQALDISKRRFTQLKKLPWALELHRISRALNSMCLSVERMLGEQTALTEKMRQKAYIDPVTGLMNRNDFSEKLNHLIATPEEFGSGALAIVRVHGFGAYNVKHGRAAGDALLQKAAHLLGKVADGRGQVLLARMDGPEFALMVPDAAPADMPALGEAIVKALGEIEEFPHTSESAMAHVGLAHYQHRADASFGALMQSANQALVLASEQDKPAWCVAPVTTEAETAAISAAARVDSLFKAGVNADRIAVLYQPVRACTDNPEWYYRSEALARVRAEDGTLVPAGLFIPVMRRLGLLDEMDRIVVSRVIQRIAIQRADRWWGNGCERFGGINQHPGFCGLAVRRVGAVSAGGEISDFRSIGELDHQQDRVHPHRHAPVARTRGALLYRPLRSKYGFGGLFAQPRYQLYQDRRQLYAGHYGVVRPAVFCTGARGDCAWLGHTGGDRIH